MKAKILLVDDDPQGLESTRKILELAGFEVAAAGDGQAALELVRESRAAASGRPDLILTDVRMPRLGGLEFLRALSLSGEETPVILMTAFGSVEDAVWAMKFGAVDFLTKPFKRQTLLTAIESALKRSRACQRPGAGRGSDAMSELLVGNSPAMKRLRDMIRLAAPTPSTVLITGESGTGKEIVARCIHEQSGRTGRFIALNCAAVPDSLIESELFGHERGSFTGATSAKEGLFEAADGGTLLLDEIGDMPLLLQATLLRTLQEGEVRRVGSNVSRKVNVRVIAATHRDLKECVRLGTFRQDLLYRLEVISFETAPLRERMEDLPALALHLLAITSLKHGKNLTGITDEALGALGAHAWPGNIRELSNVIERAVVFAREEKIGLSDLPSHIAERATAAPLEPLSRGGGRIEIPLGTSLREVEDLLIRKTLEATDGDKNMTAKLLGINSRTIYRKLDKRTE